MERVSDIPIRVVVVDDQIMVSEIMALSISKERDLFLAGVANTRRDAPEVVQRERPDVIVFNYRKSDDHEYVDVARSMLDKSPHSRIVIVSGSANDERKREDIGVDRARVVGRNSSIAEILSAIRCAARGELVVASHTH